MLTHDGNQVLHQSFLVQCRQNAAVNYRIAHRDVLEKHWPGTCCHSLLKLCAVP